VWRSLDRVGADEAVSGLIVSLGFRPQRTPERAENDRPDDGDQRQNGDDAEPDVDALDEPLFPPPARIRRSTCGMRHITLHSLDT